MSFVNLESVSLADGAQLDGFGRLRTSQPTTLFDSQQEYGLCTRRCWDGVVYDASGPTTTYTITNPSSDGSVSDAAGNAVGPRNANTRMVPVTVTVDNGDYSVLQTRNYFRYIPGKSHLVLVTGIFATGASATAKLVRRTSTSGSVVDNEVVQSSWNVDPFDGTGPSGITIDFTKTQIMAIDAQWLGVGRVRVWFDIDGKLHLAHEFLNANAIAVPYTQHFNLPVRLEARTGASSTVCRVGYFDSANGIFLSTERTSKGGSVYMICTSVQSEGGQELRGFPRTINNGVSGTTVTGALVPILSIRNAATFNSLINRAHIENDDFAVSAATTSVLYTIIVGGTLTGASWVSVGTDSCAEYDVGATAITGGLPVISGYVIAGGASSRSFSSGQADLRNPLTISQIDALATTQPAITICASKFSGANPTVNAAMNWHEQVV